VDVGVFGRVWSAQTLWHLGRADDASTRCRESLALAQRFAHPFTTTVTLAYAAVVHQHCADAETAGRLAAAAGAICEEHGFPYYGTWSSIVGGWAATMRGAPSAIGEMEQGIRRIREQGVRRCLPYYHGLLAEALLRHGRREEARRAIRRGRRIARTSGECWWNERLERLAHRLERDGAGDGRAPADGDPSTSRA